MSLLYVLGGVLSCGLLAYLLVALFRPEKF